MHLSSKQSESMSELGAKLAGLTDLICAAIQPADEPFRSEESEDLFAEIPPTRVLRLLEGRVDYFVRDKLVMHFEAGDLLGLPRSLNLPQGQFRCTGPVLLQAYERDALVEQAQQDLKTQRYWTHFLVGYLSYLEQALAQEVRGEFQPSTGFLHFHRGETIIQQGDTADQVYTLLEGEADAVCDGVVVGQIHADEIFGALAVFTRQPRMASVIASRDCTVLAVRKEEFMSLIEYQPQICQGLIEEMADKINQLNNQLLQLKNAGDTVTEE